MKAKVVIYAVVIALMGIGLAPVTWAQEAEQDKQAKIESAVSAAPVSVSDKATVQDWDGTVLRKGTNEWTCLPDNPETKGNSPMCLDEQWMKFMEAFQNESTPTYDRVGFGYMVQGGEPGSNTNPYAKSSEEAEDWSEEPGPPHLMMVVPDKAMLEGMSDDPNNGGPWVMWKDSPLVHVMIPLDKTAEHHTK